MLDLTVSFSMITLKHILKNISVNKYSCLVLKKNMPKILSFY